MNAIIEGLIAGGIIVGGAFILIGSWGLIKLPNLMSRLHGPSKATTLGVGGCLIASMIHLSATEGQLSIQEVLITAFLFLTAPVTAHFIAKTHLHLEAKPEDLPPTGGKHGWSTFDAGED